MTTIETKPTQPPTDSRGRPEPDLDEQAVEAYAEQVFESLLGAMDSYAIHIGHTLGWYQAMAGVPSMTAAELAAATSSDKRYAREWLEQQTVSGLIDVLDSSAPPESRRFALPSAAAEVLVNRDSLAFMAPFPSLTAALGKNIDRITDVFKSGEGLGWHEHGDGARCGQAEANRPLFLHVLGQEYLASIPSVHQALENGGRVADVGCGMGWSTIGVAKAYPTATVDGFDIDGPSIERARLYAAEEGVADRARFHTVDVGTLGGDEYDVVMALECVHDMSDPVSVLAAMRSMVKPDGTVLVMDERVGDRFTGENDPVERLFYGFSLICCLPDGRNAPDSVATGTVMRPDTLRQYALEAGFDDVRVADIDHDFFRFYLLEG